MEVKLEVRSDYVFVGLIGPLSLPEAHQALREAIDAAADSGLHRILLDWSAVVGIPNTEQRIEVGQLAAAHVSGRRWKEPPKLAGFGSFPAVNGLAAAVASNRGFNAQSFSDLQQALDWLGVGPGTQI